MEKILVLATKKGVVICERDGGVWVEANRGLIDREITCTLAHDGIILAGTREGVFVSVDQAFSWSPVNNGLTIKHIRWMAGYPGVSDLIFAGTEPAGIFVSYEGGEIWRSCPEVAQMRDRFNWRLPYSPQAGCVRGFAFHNQRGYAAVEDGGVLVSDDGGENWHLAEGSRGEPDHDPKEGNIHSDLHSIHVHPSSANLVYAATGGGLYRSIDGGKDWDLLYRCYCRAVWIDPEDPNHIIFGPADGVDRNGRIESSHDGGKNWELTSSGLTVPWREHMVERFVEVDGELLAVLSNGELLSTPIANLSWTSIVPEAGWIMAVGSLPLQP